MDQYQDTLEDLMWQTINPKDLWILDKLILSRHLNYRCGPTGIDVPEEGWYITRPAVNAMGLGLGAEKVWLTKDTTHLPLGHFWCEWFTGRHFSVDYTNQNISLIVEGIKPEDTLIKWSSWKKVDDFQAVEHMLKYPKILEPFKHIEHINVEFIGSKLIEVHLRKNEDFDDGVTEFIPVWKGEDTTPPEGYTYKHYPDLNGREGAFIR